MIKKRYLVLVLFASLSAIAQEYEKRGNTRILEKSQFNLNFLTPGFNIEFRIGKNQTVSSSVALAVATPQEGYLLAPAWNSRYRYYYNLNSRTRNGKNTSGNSGDYFAASYTIFIPDYKIATNIEVPNFDLRFAGAVYGIQRSYPKGFYFDAALGAGFYLGDGIDDGIGPSAHISLGWRLGKKKKKTSDFLIIK